MAGVDFDDMIASETQHSPPSPPPHSLFAEIDAAGNFAHKKTIVRTLFDMTQDSHGSHDRVARVRGYTKGGKTWAWESSDTSQNVSAATHFQLGNLFATVICHNGIHIGLAVAKSTLIKRVASGTKPVSVTDIPHGELNLPESPYMISGQVLSLVPLPHNSAQNGWVWDGNFISFSLKKSNADNGGQVNRLKNLQFTVSSRLIDGSMHEKACKVLTPTSCQCERTWAFKDDDLIRTWGTLWKRLLDDCTLHQKFPIFTSVSEGGFPYQTPSSPGNLPAFIAI